MRLYSYVVRHDIGFAPNPFYDWCTLGPCKPAIRGTAEVGDWILGTGSKSNGLEGRLVYAMQVEEVLDFDTYWNDPRFRRKRPNLRGSMKQAFGDNIYHRDANGVWQQENSRHSLNDGSANPGHIKIDTGVDSVLAGREFIYFGRNGPQVPDRFGTEYLMGLVNPGRGHRCRFPLDQVEDAVAWIRELGTGVQGTPHAW
ncbi:hypothetical protein ACIGB6_06565 [Paeniglutamicibacter gangotriensis]|uniref:Nmad2 family putative nucleotide modification protein n=1 Tax=Paeniglutamicibacter gangotriensis TaxID=254787 RepID=UPI0037C8BB5D